MEGHDHSYMFPFTFPPVSRTKNQFGREKTKHYLV